MDVGMGSKRKRSLVWMRDGDLVKWVTATGRAHKGATSTYANVPPHIHTNTHTQNDRDCPLLCSNC